MTPPGRAATTATAREPRTNEVEFSRPEDLEPRPRLDVVDRSRRATRTLHRQAKVLRTLGVMFVVGALAITAAAHTFVASDQQRIDSLQTELTQSLAEQQDLQLSPRRARVPPPRAQHRREEARHGLTRVGLLPGACEPGPNGRPSRLGCPKRCCGLEHFPRRRDHGRDEERGLRQL